MGGGFRLALFKTLLKSSEYGTINCIWVACFEIMSDWVLLDYCQLEYVYILWLQQYMRLHANTEEGKFLIMCAAAHFHFYSKNKIIGSQSSAVIWLPLLSSNCPPNPLAIWRCGWWTIDSRDAAVINRVAAALHVQSSTAATVRGATRQDDSSLIQELLAYMSRYRLVYLCGGNSCCVASLFFCILKT